MSCRAGVKRSGDTTAATVGRSAACTVLCAHLSNVKDLVGNLKEILRCCVGVVLRTDIHPFTESSHMETTVVSS